MKFNQYWFKPKRYGYGAYPSTWEGWSVTLGLVGFVAYIATRIPENNPIFFLIVASIVVLFVFFVKKKTDGEWTWNWGKK